MILTSPNFKHNEKIPVKFTGDGENINPELIIKGIPEKTKSLILIVEDPDAQRVAGFTWIHWVVFNIPVENEEVIIKENSMPGIYGESTYKKPEYRGPNPPAGSGIHHYFFKIYAIDKMLDLQPGASLEKIKGSIKYHILEDAELIGIYFR